MTPAPAAGMIEGMNPAATAPRSTPVAGPTAPSVISLVSWGALISALPNLLLIGWLVLASATTTSQDALAGLGYVLGAMLAVPVVIGLLFLGAGFGLRRRLPTTALVLASIGLGVQVVVFFCVGAMAVP